MRSVRALAAGFVFTFIGLSAQTADLIIFGGDIITVDEANPKAEAIAVENGIIVYVGDKEQALKLKNESTEMVDLQGKTLMPGLINAHTHIISQEVLERALDIGPFVNKTLDDVVATLKKAAEKGPVLAKGFDPSSMAVPQNLNIKILDEISTTVPIVVINKSGHTAYGNLKAFQQAGIDELTSNPAGGSYGHDAEGILNGFAYEVPAIYALINGFSKSLNFNYQDIATKSAKEYAKHGFTTVTDLALGLPMPKPEDHIEILRQVANAQDAPIRIQGYVVYPLLSKIQKLRENDNSRFMLRGVKIWADGSVQDYTAALDEPYLNEFSSGRLDSTSEQLELMVLEVRKKNVQVAIHADGDLAVDQALSAFENVQESRPDKDPRFRIEHATVTDEKLMHRMAEVQATPSFTNQDIYFWGKLLKDKILGSARANNIDAARSAKKLGIKFSFNDDAPFASLNPFLMMQIAVTRQMAGGGVLNSDETITIDDAIKAFTIYPAWQSFREKEIGSIEAGKLADFVIVDQNPTKVKPEEIGSIKVLQTYLNGRKVNYEN